MMQLNWADLASAQEGWFTSRGMMRFARISQPDVSLPSVIAIMKDNAIAALKNFNGTMH